MANRIHVVDSFQGLYEAVVQSIAVHAWVAHGPCQPDARARGPAASCMASASVPRSRVGLERFTLGLRPARNPP